MALALTLPLCLLFAAAHLGGDLPAAHADPLARGRCARCSPGSRPALLGLVVPLLYADRSRPDDRGGYNFEYSVDLIDAHWVAVGALVLLMAACWRVLSAAREPGAP